jgi:DNA-binding GntR family transcriptional regulator
MSNALSDPQKKQDRPADRVYDLVRRGILDGTFPSGEPLREQQLAELADASRTPVREALRRLIAEGMVTMGENRRCHVTHFSPSEVQSVYEIRTRLESFAAERACMRMTPEKAAMLREINNRIEELGPSISKFSVNKFLELNLEFHMAILHIADSRQLEAALMHALTMPLVLLKHYVWSDTVRLTLSHRQHQEIILSLESGNSAWAAACMSNHIQTSRPLTGQPDTSNQAI